MSHSIYINTALGSCITILLITIDYMRKFNTDLFQRKLMIAMLSAAFISVILDFIGLYIEGIPGKNVNIIMYCVITGFLVTQNCCYYLSAAFIDYFAYNNPVRTRKFIYVVCVFIALYSISVIANLPFGYYFTISPDNIYTPGKLYLLRLILSFAPIIIIIANIALASKDFKQPRTYLIILFIVLTGTGAVLDIILKAGSLVWPCFSASVLYIYFFIIRSDSKIDSLTGIGNRNSFNEFINMLSRHNIREEYSIVMIDLDRFKEINDTLGHPEGDNALRDMAAIIKGCIRHSDFAARFGGDEFILAAKADYDINRILDRINESVNTQNIKRARPYQLYMSYGYDVYTTNSGRSIHDFLAHVDMLMYKQKEERRAGVPSAITSKLDSNTGSRGEKNV
jgi:diguanylate cyclase (GGDEF)-like protein